MKADICDDDQVRMLLATFYEKAKADNLLGSIFSRFNNSATDFEHMHHYWTDILIRNEESLSLLPKHIYAMLTSQHFFRWSTLFLKTIDDLYAGPNAERAKSIIIKKSEQFKARLDFLPF